MTRTIFLAAAALASISLSPQQTEASEAPWCAVYSTDPESVYWDCQYHSFEECRPNALANRGWCNPSPYYVAESEAEHTQPRKRRGRPH